jgi:hypothetical protein
MKRQTKVSPMGRERNDSHIVIMKLFGIPKTTENI